MPKLDLSSFSPISLSEMDQVRLMNRVDTKYVFHADLLPQLLELVDTQYRILEINDKRQALYETLYFDTPDFSDYHMHHRGKLNRHKIRMRKYVDSQLCFLEVKHKNNKGRTTKLRIGIDNYSSRLEVFTPFFQEVGITRFSDYVPALLNRFSRITLVDINNPQRITIDTNLMVATPDETHKKELSNLVIVEVKQASRSQSEFADALKQLHILPGSFSKYSIGIVSLYDTVKYNRFKSKLLYLQKITN